MGSLETFFNSGSLLNPPHLIPTLNTLVILHPVGQVDDGLGHEHSKSAECLVNLKEAASGLQMLPIALYPRQHRLRFRRIVAASYRYVLSKYLEQF